jgi:hypothetical protein
MTIRARTNTLVFPTVFTFTNAEAVINTDNVQNETRKRKISENICSNEEENEDTEMNGQHNECEILPSCN